MEKCKGQIYRSHLEQFQSKNTNSGVIYNHIRFRKLKTESCEDPACVHCKEIRVALEKDRKVNFTAPANAQKGEVFQLFLINGVLVMQRSDRVVTKWAGTRKQKA